METQNKNSKARINANNKFIANNYKRITVTINNDLASKFENYCSKNGLSKNGAITQLIEKELKQDETSSTQ